MYLSTEKQETYQELKRTAEDSDGMFFRNCQVTQQSHN